MNIDPNTAGYYWLLAMIPVMLAAIWFASRESTAKLPSGKRFVVLAGLSGIPLAIVAWVASSTPIFASQWYLLTLLLVPVVWYISCESLSSMGSFRRFFALAFRTLVMMLIVSALAEMQFLRTNDRMTVIYLLDQSESIPKPVRESMVKWVKRNVTEFRSVADKAAVIVFGSDAAIEVAPLDDDLPLAGRLETSVYDLRPDATNLAQALKLAQATFPEDSSRRIVIVSDGNENEGDSQSLIQVFEEEGISVDVAPVQLRQRAEVEVDKVAIPSDTRKGQPFDASVVINNLGQPTTEDDAVVGGKLRVWRRQGKDTQLISEQEVELPPGKRVFQFRNVIEEEDFYEYQAEFVPDNPNVDDVLAQNNRATAFTHVLGSANVLLIEDWENQGNFETLVERLRDQEINITVQTSDQLFTSLAELQRYDCVILADVPRSSGNVDVQTNFSDEQIDILVRNTQKLGCGLIMLGGERSFGAGGWANSELEKAMPVDFQIYNAKVVPVGALAMVMHASEMAQGNYWQKIISREALKVLGPHDYCGVVHWEGREEWLWGKPRGLIKVGRNKDKMMARLSQMTPGDMPEFDPSLAMAVASFAQLGAAEGAATKHMIIISDGDPSPPTQKTLQAFKDLGVKVSTVAVGTHGPAGSTLLSRIAKFTGGRYYVVKNPKALPRIFQKETMRIARPLVKEKPGLMPIVSYQHEILKGIDAMPPFDGFVLTSKKENSLVDVILKSPEPGDNPAGRDNNTLLASWTYGAGRTVAFTTDAGHRWTTDWTNWDGYDQFFGQMIRWAMRPTGNNGKFSVATQIKNGEGKVIVTAIDEEDNLINFLDIGGDVILPDMKSADMDLKQVAPGRYEGTFDATAPGSYFVALAPGPKYGSLRTGVNVPYSAEYQDRETNQELLSSLANVEIGGEPGKIHPINFEQTIPSVSENDSNTFRPSPVKQISTQDIWPLLLLTAGCLFLADVFVRRVAINFDWLQPVVAQVRASISGEEVETKPDERMQRLRSRKAAVHDELDDRKAAARFEPEPEEDVDMSVLDQSSQLAAEATERKQQESMEAQAEEESYTERLLKAKKQARKDIP